MIILGWNLCFAIKISQWRGTWYPMLYLIYLILDCIAPSLIQDWNSQAIALFKAVISHFTLFSNVSFVSTALRAVLVRFPYRFEAYHSYKASSEDKWCDCFCGLELNVGSLWDLVPEMNCIPTWTVIERNVNGERTRTATLWMVRTRECKKVNARWRIYL